LLESRAIDKIVVASVYLARSGRAGRHRGRKIEVGVAIAKCLM
jgi:hypothetical protein